MKQFFKAPGSMLFLGLNFLEKLSNNETKFINLKGIL